MKTVPETESCSCDPGTRVAAEPGRDKAGPS